MEKLIAKSRDILTGIEISMERARLMCVDLCQDFFGINTGGDDAASLLMYHFNRARIQNDIVFDYIFEVDKQVNELKEVIKQLSNLSKEEDVAA